MESTQSLHDNLSVILGASPDVRLAYLFGSRVDGTPGPMSDHDFGVLLDPNADQLQVQAELAHRLAHTLDTDRIDILVLNRAPVELAFAVIARGMLLYEQDIATRVEYEAYVMGRHGDYLPVLRAHRRDILQGDDHVRRVQRYREAFGRTERTLGQIAAAHGKSPD